MANFTTAADLKADALKLAGEPSDGSSLYDSEVYSMLQSVQNAVISGGQFGPSALQPTDWLWARAYPRGVIQLQLPFNADSAISATFTQSSKTVTLGSSVGTNDLANWRIAVDTLGQRPVIDSASSTTITLRDAWTDATVTTANWLAFKSEYDLPDDFVRGVSTLFVSGYPYRIPVVESAQLESLFPFTTIEAGWPELAARVTQSKLRFSHYLGTTAQGAAANVLLQLEFEYIRRAEIIAEGSIPVIPVEHRRVLSYGAAWQMLDDKDDSSADRMWLRFQAQYKALLDEHRRDARAMSPFWGVVRPRVAPLDQPLVATPLWW